MISKAENNPAIKFAFFGSSKFSIYVLDELDNLGFKPSFIVTSPDKPQGRKLVMTPNIVKTWALQKNIFVLDPVKLDKHLIDALKKFDCDVFVVASFGRIIPQTIIDLPKHGSLNIHPSLLPKYRGPSPLPTAILEDEKSTGISIMKMDEQMDHGPLVASKEIQIDEWPTYEAFEEKMACEGAKLLAHILPRWIQGEMKAKEQEHSKATYTKKITKEDALIDLSSDPYSNFRKIQAYHEWPKACFTIQRDGQPMRIKITQASFQNGNLIIQKVIPEGGREMKYEDFKRGYSL